MVIRITLAFLFVCVCTHMHVYVCVYLNKKNFFLVRVTEHWNRLPREAVESPSLEILKTRLDTVLNSVLEVTLVEQGGVTR